MHNRSYNPLSDPLMPRLFRKISHQTHSVYQGGSRTQHNTSMTNQQNSFFQSKEISVYDNSTSQMGKEKYSLVSIPLRTKVSTGRPYLEGKSPSMSIMAPSQNMHGGGADERHHYQETLKEMKQMIQERAKGASG